MAKEIERKFLVRTDQYISMAYKSEEIYQGYLSTHPNPTVRIRTKGDKAYMTVKGSNHGVIRDEWEFEIPMDDARQMLEQLCGDNYIHKFRYLIDYNGLLWEVDRFEHPHKGLVLAEVEVPSPETPIRLPEFVGKEVSEDPRYYNSSLLEGRPLE